MRWVAPPIGTHRGDRHRAQASQPRSVRPFARSLPRQHGPPEGGVSASTTRRAVSTQLLVGNPVYAHYRRHVTPGVCRRGGTLRRGSPGLSIARADHSGHPARARQILHPVPHTPCADVGLPVGFLMAARLARARAVPQSHRHTRTRLGECGSGGARRHAGPGERCAQPLTVASAALCRVAAPHRIRGEPPHRATIFKGRSRVCGRGDPAGSASAEASWGYQGRPTLRVGSEGPWNPNLKRQYCQFTCPQSQSHDGERARWQGTALPCVLHRRDGVHLHAQVLWFDV